MIENKNTDSTKGFAGLIVIAAVAVLIIGAGAYLMMQKPPAEKTGEVNADKAGESVENVGISVPELNFSASPLSDLNVSSLNVGAPQFSFGNIFSAPSVDFDFSYKSNVELSIPSPKIDFELPSVPSGKPTGQPSSAPSGVPSASSVNTPSPSTPEEGKQQSAVNAANCAQFSTMPSAQYCSMVSNSSGKTLCEQCKAAGL